jgi:hypothetical protein
MTTDTSRTCVRFVEKRSGEPSTFSSTTATCLSTGCTACQTAEPPRLLAAAAKADKTGGDARQQQQQSARNAECGKRRSAAFVAHGGRTSPHDLEVVQRQGGERYQRGRAKQHSASRLHGSRRSTAALRALCSYARPRRAHGLHTLRRKVTARSYEKSAGGTVICDGGPHPQPSPLPSPVALPAPLCAARKARGCSRDEARPCRCSCEAAARVQRRCRTGAGTACSALRQARRLIGLPRWTA